MKRKGVNLEPQLDPNGLLFKQLMGHRAYRIVSLTCGDEAETGTFIGDGCENLVACNFFGLLGFQVKGVLHPFTGQSGILIVRTNPEGKTSLNDIKVGLGLLRLDPSAKINPISFGFKGRYIFIPLKAEVVEEFYTGNGVAQDNTNRANHFKNQGQVT